MKKLVLLICFILPHISFAQDSLQQSNTLTSPTQKSTPSQVEIVAVDNSQIRVEQKLLAKLKRDPKDEETYRTLIEFYRKAPQKRIQIAYQAVQKIGRKSFFYTAIGDAFLDLKNYQKALDNYQVALTLYPTSYYIYEQIGTANTNLENYHSAEVAYEASLTFAYNTNNKVKASLYKKLALVMEKRNQKSKAASLYKQALDLAPDDPEIRSSLDKISNQEDPTI